MMLPLLKILLEFSRTPFLEWSSSCHIGAAHFFRERDSNDHVPFLFPLSTWAVADSTWQPVIKENWICILCKLREHTGFIYKYQILKTLKIWKVALVLSKIKSLEGHFISSLELKDFTFASAQIQPALPSLLGKQDSQTLLGQMDRKGDLVYNPYGREFNNIKITKLPF